MNLGFFIGFAVAGHYRLTEDYRSLLLFATVGNFLAIVLAALNWKRLADCSTPLLEVTSTGYRVRSAGGLPILVGLVPVVWYMLQRAGQTEALCKAISVAVALGLVYLTVGHRDKAERNHMWAYLVTGLGSLLFWSLYMMVPSGLQLFAINNVDPQVWGIPVAPQWVQNINTVVIVLGGPLMAVLFARLRSRGWKIDLPQQHQGIMMGSWMMVTGVASLSAGDFSGMIPVPSGHTPLTSNPGYSSLSATLGWGSLAVGVVLVLLIRFLRRLIRPQGPARADAPAVALEESA